MKFGERVGFICRCAWRFCSHLRAAKFLSSGQMFVLITEGVEELERRFRCKFLERILDLFGYLDSSFGKLKARLRVLFCLCHSVV